MPADRRLPARLSLIASAHLAVVAMASTAHAAPTPTPTGAPTPTATPQATADPCALLDGPSKQYCQSGTGTSGGAPQTGLAPSDGGDALNPLASLARGCADAASWIVTKLSEAVNGSAEVDFTNPAFLKQYSVVFAASTILTLVLWLFAVAKRAVRGVPLTTAMSEAIGFLWLTVLASAFTPSSSTPSSPPPTASPRSSPPPPAARPTSSSAPSRKPSRRATTSAAARSC